MREHNMCLQEILRNIEELESKTKTKINPNFIKDIVLNSPIELEIPFKVNQRKELSAEMPHFQPSENNFVTIAKEVIQRGNKAETPKAKNVERRENDWQISAINDYIRDYNFLNQRSCNVDDSNHSLSIFDESEACDVLDFLA